VGRFADLARYVLQARPRLGSVRLVTVDGPAGSGKTTFAGRLAGALRTLGADVAEVHTDDLLAGWTDLVSFWPRLADGVLDPLGRGEVGGYRRYDWHAGRFVAEVTPVPVPDVLVVEGVSSGRVAVRPLLTLGVYVSAGPDVRLARGIARDGEALGAQWLRWMADEQEHFDADHTVQHADLVVDGDPGVPHDREIDYIPLTDRRWTRPADCGTIAKTLEHLDGAQNGEDHR
jgi:uridine kinase